MTLKQAIDLLRESGIDSPEYDAREIFKVFMGRNVMLNDKCDDPMLEDMIERRRMREPLQYIIGSVGFYREEYYVSPDCLIPRADTETLVDYAVKNIPEGESFIDLCTGSGCVAISTLKNTKSTTAYAVDISKGALDLASKNAERNGVADRISLVNADVMKDALCDRVYAVLSNPPYIREDVYPGLEKEIFHEPKIAFVGGADGLDFYRRLTPIYRDRIKDGGFIAYEIGYDQGEDLKKIAEENKMTVEILKDLSGQDRVAVLRKR